MSRVRAARRVRRRSRPRRTRRRRRRRRRPRLRRRSAGKVGPLPAARAPRSQSPSSGVEPGRGALALTLVRPHADSSDESDSSEESDIDSEASSALFMAVRPGPGQGRVGGRLSPDSHPNPVSAEEEDAPQEGAEAVGRQLSGQQPAGHAQRGDRQHLFHPAGRRHQAGAG